MSDQPNKLARLQWQSPSPRDVLVYSFNVNVECLEPPYATDLANRHWIHDDCQLDNGQ